MCLLSQSTPSGQSHCMAGGYPLGYFAYSKWWQWAQIPPVILECRYHQLHLGTGHPAKMQLRQRNLWRGPECWAKAKDEHSWTELVISQLLKRVQKPTMAFFKILDLVKRVRLYTEEEILPWLERSLWLFAPVLLLLVHHYTPDVMWYSTTWTRIWEHGVS